jgi:hypothetical protein
MAAALLCHGATARATVGARMCAPQNAKAGRKAQPSALSFEAVV